MIKKYLTEKNGIMLGIILFFSLVSVAQCALSIVLDLNIPYDFYGIIFLSSFCGAVPGIIGVCILFIYKLFVQFDSLYAMSLFMLISMIASSAAKRGIYKKKLKPIPMFMLFSLFCGAYVLIYNVIAENGLTTETYWQSFKTFLFSMPASVITVIVIRLFFKLCPDHYRKYFRNSLYYSDSEENKKELEIEKKKFSGLSSRITALTTIEAGILALVAAFFANLLIGSMDFSAVIKREDPSFSENRAMLEEHFQHDPNQEGEEPPERPEGEEGEDMFGPPPFLSKALSRNNSPIIEHTLSGENIFSEKSRRFGEMLVNTNLSFENQMSFIFRLVMLLFIFSFIVGLGANFFAQRQIAEPIKDMSKAMENFAYSSGDMKVEGTEEITTLRVQTKDEIEDLYNAIVKTVNDMNIYLERIQEEEKIENALKVAQAANEAKSSFLSSMSHEIRTPINAVLGFDEMILMENKDPEIEKYAEDIQSAGKTLLSLINDILDFSKIEAGKMNIVPVQYELSSTVNDLINMASSLARDKGLFFDVNVDSRMPHLLYGDEIRLKQIMLNILTNAVKYTEKGGVTFDIGFEKIDDSHIYFKASIKDTGIGIRKEDMEKLFSPFERLDEQRNSSVVGTGLGMSITIQLLEKMDSKLEVDSVYGEGSTFSFRVIQEVTNWEEVGNLSEAFKKYLPHEADKHKNDKFRAPDARILVVDDTEFNILVVQRLLKRTEIKIDTSSSGKDALNLICLNKYDIVYIDHMMPEMDGIDTFRAMQTLEGNLNRDIPWIVLTANAVSGARDKYMEAGFTDYMTKPVNYLTLKNSLIKYLPGDKVMEDDMPSDEEESGIDADSQVKKAMDAADVLDYEEGISNSGSEDILLEVMEGYLASIDEKADTIEKTFDEKDYKNYTIFVHALKSSSRLIGAMEVSKLAAEMEAMGNAVQDNPEGSKEREEAAAAIEDQTGKLLDMFKGLKEPVRSVIGDKKEEAEDKPEIDEASLKEILSAICEFADAFDFDNADSAVAELDKYSIPDGQKETVEKIRNCVRNIDRDGILELKDRI